MILNVVQSSSKRPQSVTIYSLYDFTLKAHPQISSRGSSEGNLRRVDKRVEGPDRPYCSIVPHDCSLSRDENTCKLSKLNVRQRGIASKRKKQVTCGFEAIFLLYSSPISSPSIHSLLLTSNQSPSPLSIPRLMHKCGYLIQVYNR